MPEDICVSYSCEGMKQMICWSMALLHLLQTETEQLRIRCSFSSEFVYIPSSIVLDFYGFIVVASDVFVISIRALLLDK